MTQTMEFAGYFAAHAVWCVSDGETLTPMLASGEAGMEANLQRFSSDDNRQAVEEARAALETAAGNTDHAVLIYDGFITLDGNQVDALVLEIRSRGGIPGSLQMILPYRHARSPQGFAVGRPKLIGVEGAEAEASLLADAFFQGVEHHSEGAALWSSHLDESM